MTLSTLDKGLRVLEALARHEGSDGLTLTELGRVLGMHRTTLFRFLGTLHARGYVERDPATDRYRLGLQLLTLASRLLSRLDLRALARHDLLAIADRCQELVLLAVLDDGEVVTVERIEGKQPIGLQTEIGARRPAYCTASGKAMLAYLPADDVDRILAAGMPALTGRTITVPERMHQLLAEIRERGYAIDNEERIDGVRCVAAPILDFELRVVGAISIAAPSQRMPWGRVRQLGEEVRSAAEAISRRVGYPEALATADGELPQSERPPLGII